MLPLRHHFLLVSALLLPGLALAQGGAAPVTPSVLASESAPSPPAAGAPESGAPSGAASESPQPQPDAPAPPPKTPATSELTPATSEPTPAASEPTPAADSKPQIEVSGAPGQGVTFKAGEKFSLNVKARIQLRYQLTDPPGPSEPQQGVSVGTLRLHVGGNVLSPNLTYLIQLALAARDYRDGTISPVYDAFFDYKAHRDLNLKVGQYFVPFDRLRTVREFALQLAERPRPVAELTLDRDVGLSLYSDKFLGDDSPLAYRLGIFGGGGINLTTGRDPGALVVGRLELRPLGALDDDSEGDLDRRAKPAIALGVAGAININSNRMRSTTGATFLGGTTDYYHAAADMVFKWRGFALQAEYLYKSAYFDVIRSTGADGSALNEATRSGQGWITQASYLFELPIEVVGRLSGLYAFEGTDPLFVTELDRFGQEVAAGVNYYFNKHRFKVQGDWIARMPHDFDFSVAENTAHLQLDATF